MRNMFNFCRLAFYLSLVFFAGSILCAGGKATEGAGPALPQPLSAYAEVEAKYATEKGIEVSELSCMQQMMARAAHEPMNWIATLIFFFAILHTFLAGKIMALAHKEDHRHQAKIARDARDYPEGKAPVEF